MPSKPVYGKDVLLLFLVNGIYQQAACATDCELSVNTDTLEVTTKTNVQGAGAWRRLVGVKNSWSGSVSGVEFLDTTIVKLADIRQFQTDRIPVKILFTETDKTGTAYSNWYGIAVITNTTNRGGSDGFGTFDISLEGDGILRADFDPTNINEPIEMFYYYTATGNEGRSWIISDLVNCFPNGRIYREGLEQDASGNEPMNRPAVATPLTGQYKWDTSTGRLTLATVDPELSAGERITIPYTLAYSGCSLVISRFTVGLNNDQQFYFTWLGTGLPSNQILFEYSDDYGETFNALGVTIDEANLDNATYTGTLDTEGHYVFRITPICTNGQYGKPSYQYWKATIIHVDNRGAGVDLLDITILATDNTYPSQAFTSDSQPTQINFTKLISPGMSTIALTTQGNTAARGTVTDMSGNVLGTALGASNEINIPVNNVPGEINLILLPS